MSERKIRVLVADDSALMRKKISEIINSDSACETIATARNGEEVLRSVAALRPDVVTLDVEMPKMDGITTLKYLMSEWPTPVVILSGYSRYQGIETIKCLEYGAVDLVAKPNGALSLDIAHVNKELLSKVKAAAKVRLGVLRPRMSEPPAFEKKEQKVTIPSTKVIAIASSTGGPRALVEVLPKLPRDLPAGVVVIQHMPGGFTDSMAERLNNESQLRVKEAENDEPLKQGVAYVAPGGFHLTLASERRSVAMKLVKGPKEHGVCPSADVTMKSVAFLFGSQSMGVVLTGMGDDGTEGLREIKRLGGYTIAQDRATSIVYGMPKVAVDAGVVDRIVPLPDIAAEIIRWAREGSVQRTAFSGQFGGNSENRRL